MAQTAAKLEQLMTRREAAELCSVHPHTLIRATRAGELRVVKRGRLIRYRPSDLQAWLQLHTVGGDAR